MDVLGCLFGNGTYRSICGAKAAIHLTELIIFETLYN